MGAKEFFEFDFGFETNEIPEELGVYGRTDITELDDGSFRVSYPDGSDPFIIKPADINQEEINRCLKSAKAFDKTYLAEGLERFKISAQRHKDRAQIIKDMLEGEE